MRRSMKFVLCAVLSFMFVFSCFGFATLTDKLSVSGSAKAEPPNAVFITDATVVSTNVSNESHEVIMPTNLECSFSGARNRAVTYMITVKNNTPYKYAYSGIDYVTSTTYNGNSYIGNGVTVTTKDKQSDSSGTFNSSDTLEPGAVRTFYVTYTISRTQAANKNLNFLVNFKFGIHVDSAGDAAIDNALEKFTSILNDTSAGGGYEVLADKIDDKYDGRNDWKANYIGNVGNAVDNDMMTVETLFAGQLTMIVNGKTQKAWVLIKHENLDNNEMTGDDYTLNYNQYGLVTHKGCEMTLYLTVDKLDKANGWAPVYATVFTCDRDAAGNTVSEWYKVGDSYYGQANIVGYRGESGGTGSFVTDNWKSHSSSYQVSEDYSYNVGADITIKTLMQTVDQTTINAFQRLLIDSEEMIANEKYAGTGIRVVEDAYRKAAKFYTLNESGKAIANNDTRRVWLIPIMNELNHVLTVAQDAIDEIEQGKQN